MSDKTTFVSFLLDETGSMQSIEDDTIGGFNAYLETLQKSGGEIVFSLVSFNSSVTRRRYVAEPVRDVRSLTADDYEPKAMTPLIDATVKIIEATAEAVEKRGDQPNVVIVVQTDGRENVSVEHTSADLASLVKEKEAAGWQFVFLGADLDAFETARAAGMDLHPEVVIGHQRGKTREVFAALADNVSKYAESGDAADLRFSQRQRDAVGEESTRRRSGGGGGATPERSSRKAAQRRKSTADPYKLS